MIIGVVIKLLYSLPFDFENSIIINGSVMVEVVRKAIADIVSIILVGLGILFFIFGRREKNK